MKFSIYTLLLIASIFSPAEARITVFNFSGVVQSESFNGDDATGLNLLPVRTGDLIRGSFDFDDSIVPLVSFFRDPIASYNNPTRKAEINFFRNDRLALTVTLIPVTFRNGNPADQSNVALIDRDGRSRRDSLSLSLQGGDFDSGSVLSFNPNFPNIVYSAFDIDIREQCASGSVELGNCVSNSPELDLFNGANPQVDFLRAFNNGGSRFISFGFNFADGSFGDIGATLDSLSAVPEAETWAMMIIGLGCVGSMSRKRRYRLKT
jgi:hypothetical protein